MKRFWYKITRQYFKLAVIDFMAAREAMGRPITQVHAETLVRQLFDDPDYGGTAVKSRSSEGK